MTHLHVDHASGIAEFPEATFVVCRAEWEAATSQGQTHGYVTRQFDHAFDYRLLDFEGRDAESFSGFARSFDLFGDGSVRTVYTPGHTLGHMSVVLRTGAGEVLVAGDAIYLRRTLDDTHLPYRTEDEHLFRRSLREIRQYATRDARRAGDPGPRLGGVGAAALELLVRGLALGQHGHVDQPAVALPADQRQRLHPIEHELERVRLARALVAAADVERAGRTSALHR